MPFPLTVFLDYYPGRKYAQRVGSRVQTNSSGRGRSHSRGRGWSHQSNVIPWLRLCITYPHSPPPHHFPHSPPHPLAQTQPPPSAHFLPTPSYSHFRRIKGPASGDLEPALDMELSFCLTIQKSLYFASQSTPGCAPEMVKPLCGNGSHG